ncbi:LIC_10091 family protein [Mesoterricola silvestris]|uniref:DUF7790 domain-containing protein n=1 Tax=Mesoterricola silvestris TaxID=2927979 RepID=A0AA48GRD7_9BACT|nr:hypothetical protein [Mesoterricola silvestris]BDU74305.1 hypothetical protein METEAL_34790 [Mesoterricola silvestris]
MLLESSLVSAGLGLFFPQAAPPAAPPPALSPFPTVAAEPWTTWLPRPGTRSGCEPAPAAPGSGTPLQDLPPEPPVEVVAPLELEEDNGHSVLLYPGRLVTNERGLPALARHLGRAEGGAFIGVGALSSLLQLGMQRRERGILLDYDREVVRLNRGLLALIRAINETPGARTEIQRYQFLCALCMADVPGTTLEGVAKGPGGPQARFRALLEHIGKAPLLDPARAAEHLRPALKTLAKVYTEATLSGGPANLMKGLENQARKSWRGTPSFETHLRGHQGRFAAQVMKAEWEYYFRHLVATPAEAAQLFPMDDAAWQRLAAMHGEGRIQVMRADLTKGDGALAALGRALKAAGVPVTVLYASNAMQHFGSVPANRFHFLANLDALPWADDAVVLMAGTPGLLPAILTRAQEDLAEAGGDVFTYHALRPQDVRVAVGRAW